MARGERSENDPNRKVDRDAVMRSLIGQMMGTEKTSSQKKEEAFKGLVDDIAMSKHRQKNTGAPVIREDKTSDMFLPERSDELRPPPWPTSQEYSKKKQ